MSRRRRTAASDVTPETMETYVDGQGRGRENRERGREERKPGDKRKGVGIKRSEHGTGFSHVRALSLSAFMELGKQAKGSIKV